MSQRVWHPAHPGETVQQGSSLPYPGPSFPSREQRLTDGCHELHVSCPFSFSSHQACKAQQASSLGGAGQPPWLPRGCGSSSFLPFPRSWGRPAQQPHLKRQERQHWQGQENTSTQVEKRLRKEGFGHCMQHTSAAIVCCLAQPQLLAELGAGQGSLMVTRHKLMFSHIAHTTWTAFPLQLFLLAQFQISFSSWDPVCDATMKTVSSRSGIRCFLSR